MKEKPNTKEPASLVLGKHLLIFLIYSTPKVLRIDSFQVFMFAFSIHLLTLIALSIEHSNKESPLGASIYILTLVLTLTIGIPTCSYLN